MGSVQEKILQILKDSDRPMTTIEVSRSVYGDYPAWEQTTRRSNIYGKMRMLERQGYVKRSKSLIKKDCLWWLP